jgi:hypothetical protein
LESAVNADVPSATKNTARSAKPLLKNGKSFSATPFTIHVGALDAAYDRSKVAPTWGRKIEELRKADPGGDEKHSRAAPFAVA